MICLALPLRSLPLTQAACCAMMLQSCMAQWRNVAPAAAADFFGRFAMILYTLIAYGRNSADGSKTFHKYEIIAGIYRKEKQKEIDEMMKADKSLHVFIKTDPSWAYLKEKGIELLLAKEA